MPSAVTVKVVEPPINTVRPAGVEVIWAGPSAAWRLDAIAAISQQEVARIAGLYLTCMVDWVVGMVVGGTNP